jgi:hypothetical protein
MSHKKFKVFSLTVNDGAPLICVNRKDVMDTIEAEISEIKEGDGTAVFEVEVKRITQKEYDNLPEWEG